MFEWGKRRELREKEREERKREKEREKKKEREPQPVSKLISFLFFQLRPVLTKNCL